MVARRQSEPQQERTRRRPATTPELREIQMVSLAVELAERQMREGTASAQVISHYLKLGSSREKLEQQRITHENELLKAKAEAMASAARVEEMYGKALKAMRQYSGHEVQEEQEEYYDE